MSTSGLQLDTPAIVTSADTTPGTQAALPWAVRMRNIGKKYQLGEVRHINDNFREDVMNFFGRAVGRAPRARTEKGTFWALRDINAEFGRGDTIGIIGRNGAGKSTMLKILSRITSPTTGEFQYRGRLASLLEVGTGFHRELTGRENVFLNGSILGMKRAEIQQRFDEIVAFAGVEKFVDTPVKFYSSGMKVRLAFAVAAHLRTDILVVDEVLAVGDAQFQKKCLGKMQDVAQDGRTVLFVSHNMGAVQRLCERGLFIQAGKIRTEGPTSKVIHDYLSSMGDMSIQALESYERPPELGREFRFTRCLIKNSSGEPATNFQFGEPFVVEVEVKAIAPRRNHELSLVIGIDSLEHQVRIASCASEDASLSIDPSSTGTVYRIAFENPQFAPGSFGITLALRAGRQTIFDRVQQCATFEVVEIPWEGQTMRSFLGGYLRLYPEWRIESHDNPSD